MIIWGSFVNKINEVKSHEFQNQDTSITFPANGALHRNPAVQAMKH